MPTYKVKKFSQVDQNEAFMEKISEIVSFEKQDSDAESSAEE